MSEGSRFAPAMIASGVYAGLFEKDHAWSLSDSDGKTLGDELKRSGVDELAVRTDQPYSASLHRFFRMRERRQR